LLKGAGIIFQPQSKPEQRNKFVENGGKLFGDEEDNENIV
jgi:hypothetical protein